jgi:dihydroneopterin aldolase
MSREENLIRVTVTACMNMELIVDTMTSVVIDMIQEAKKIGIYKQERKKRLNDLMHEVKLHQNMLDRRAGEAIGNVADYNEAFSEQIAEVRNKSYEAAKKVLEDTGVLYPSYLAYLHQARVVGVASYVAIEIWHKKMKVASSPLPCEYTLEPFRPKKVMDRMQQMLTFEFRKYQCKEQNSELAQQADQEFVGKMADTDMICAIMEGRIKPSWMAEDEANNSAEESVNE